MFKDPSAIAVYHAHVYFDSPETRERAAQLRAGVAADFPDARLGSWHEQPVGPHTRPMYQILFAADRLAALLPWLMLNHRGLSILLHPDSGDDYADHAEHAAWLGPPLPLRLDILKRAE